jgi:GntR family transcriptional regulator
MTTEEAPPRAELPHLGNGSLTEQTTSALLDAILAGRYTGSRLPAEPKLAEQLGVSRTTIRGALMSLERLGIISRTPGRGTVVRPHVGRESIVLQRLIGFRGLLEERHEEVTVSQRYWLEDRPSERGLAKLDLAEDARVIRSAKTLTADGTPAIWISDEIPLDVCSPAVQQVLLDAQDLSVPDSIFEFSKTWPDGEIDHTVIELTPAAAAAHDDTLVLADGTPFMRMLETHYRFDGRPLALSEVHVDDRYVRFAIVRHT